MKLGLGRRGLSFGGSGGPPKPVTDFFNGFELSGSTFSGGPTVVADNTGALVTSPADVLPIEGMRLSGSTWLPTTTEGAQIHTSTPLRTRKGTVSVYDESFKGPLVQPVSTNKCTCRKANPVDTTNIARSGDDAAVLSVVDDTAALAAAGLSDICTSGKVYKLDNSAGVANAFAILGGEVGNLNNHSAAMYARGAGYIYIENTTANRRNMSPDYTQLSIVNTTITQTFRQLAVVCEPGDIAYFILPQLEEGAFVTTTIALDSTEADPLTALTRPAANLTRPTAGTALAALNNWGIRLRFRPTASGQTAVLWGSHTDANNATRIDLTASTLTYTKRLSGTDHVAQASLTHAAATLYDVIIYQHSVSGMGIAFRSWNGSAWSAWSAWTALTDANGIANAAIASTYQWGAANNASHVSANMPFCHVFTLKAALAAQTEIADLLSKGRI
jgi:hypothetical protein